MKGFKKCLGGSSRVEVANLDERGRDEGEEELSLGTDETPRG